MGRMAAVSHKYYNNIERVMSRELRPSSGKTQPAQRSQTPSIEDERGSSKEIKDQASKFKSRFECIRSARERKPLPEQPSLTLDCESREPIASSKSKFLERFNTIRSSRPTCNQDEPSNAERERQKEEFETNKKQLYVDAKLNNISIQNSVVDSHDFDIKPETVAIRKVNKNYLHAPPSDHLRTRPRSAGVEFVELNKIPVQELILRLEDSSKAEQEENYTIGYWKGENRFVSLIPLEKNEKVSFWHPNILPIYAEVTLKAKRYVISDEYKNCSLKNLLEEFGPFEESLGKRYLKQVALGLQHMHFHRRGHNRLTVKTILYNKNGELFINAVRSTSFVPSREELLTSKELHYFAPEFLLSKGFSRSLKNDAWALGCLAILMLTSTGLTRSPLHPYNFKKFDSSSEEQMIDNLMQLHTAYFSQSIGEEQVYRASHEGKRRVLSEAALNFISSCFKILSDERASIEALLEHQFFEGV